MQNIANPDGMIIIAYLIITLVVGVRAGTSNTNIRQYAIGNREFTTPVLVMAMLATLVGAGRTIGDISKIHSDGLIYSFALLGIPICFCLSAILISPKLEKFKGCISTASIIKKVYGDRAGTIAALVGFFQCFGVVGGQILAMGYLLEVTLEVPLMYGAIASGTIMIIYSAVGGGYNSNGCPTIYVAKWDRVNTLAFRRTL